MLEEAAEASGTATVFAGLSLHGQLDGSLGFSFAGSWRPLSGDFWRSPQQCFVFDFSPWVGVREAGVVSDPNRAVVQQQSKGPTNSDSTNW